MILMKVQMCRHRYKEIGYSGKSRLLVCEKCGCRVEKPHSKTSLRRFNSYMNRIFRKDSRLHKPMHLFSKAVSDKIGWECMKSVEKALPSLKKKFPGRILFSNCDDSYFSSSQIYLITHETGKKGWMGITMWYIPQCSGEKPISLFLYPNHLRMLTKQLLKLQERMEKRIGVDNS